MSAEKSIFDNILAPEISLSDYRYIPLLPENTDTAINEYINEFNIEGDFDKAVVDKEKTDYLLATASGIISGTISVLMMERLDIEAARNWGEKEVQKFVIDVAEHFAKKSDMDIYDAIRFLEKKFPIAADERINKFGGSKQHHLRDFSHHASIVGFLFSLLTQFTGMAYGTDTAGKFIIVDVSESGLIGKTLPEKISLGFIQWFFHLVSDMAGSTSTPGKGAGIPGPLLSLAKELSAIPLLNKNIKFDGNEAPVSVVISKLYNGTAFKDSDGKPLKFDLRTEIGFVPQFFSQAKSVLVNECIVRSVYSISRVLYLVRSKETIDELTFGDIKTILPFANAEIARMCTVSSGVFMAINSGAARVKAVAKSDKNLKKGLCEFALHINYVGLVRFVIACTVDISYSYEKIVDESRLYAETQTIELLKYNGALVLTDSQTRLLHNYERRVVLNDISRTKNKKDHSLKVIWMNNWVEKLKENQQEDYFVDDPKEISKLLNLEMENSCYQDGWQYNLCLQLILFRAYTPLGIKQDKKIKGVKYSGNYLAEEFVKEQKIINKKDIDIIKSKYYYYVRKLDKKGKLKKNGLKATFAMSLIAGGAAFVFAPSIAVLYAGGQFAGLYGAVLTSASLASIGGGSIAAGGLGMAGGTAAITLTSAGASMISTQLVSAVNVFANSSEEEVIRHLSEILTLCDYVYNSENKNKEFIVRIRNQISDSMYDIIAQIEKSKYKHKIALKANIECIENTIKLLDSMCD